MARKGSPEHCWTASPTRDILEMNGEAQSAAALSDRPAADFSRHPPPNRPGRDRQVTPVYSFAPNTIRKPSWQ